MIPTRFHVPRRTQDSTRSSQNFVYRACTFFDWPFNAIRLSINVPSRGPTTPTQCRFGLLPLRSPLLRESFLFSFPPATKMFQFAGFLPTRLCIHLVVTPHYQCWVSPFGYPRIFVYLPLPEAFRRLLRPSSAVSAKASTVRPFLLNLFFVFLLTKIFSFLLLCLNSKTVYLLYANLKLAYNCFFDFSRLLSLSNFLERSCLSSVIRFSKNNFFISFDLLVIDMKIEVAFAPSKLNRNYLSPEVFLFFILSP